MSWQMRLVKKSLRSRSIFVIMIMWYRRKVVAII